MNKVIDGDYKGERIWGHLVITYIDHMSFTSKATTIDFEEEVSKVVVLDVEETKSLKSTLGRGLIGGVLLGPVGVLGGALTGKKKKSRLIRIYFKDGKESIAEVDNKIFKRMLMKLNVEGANEYDLYR